MDQSTFVPARPADLGPFTMLATLENSMVIAEGWMD